VAFQRQEKEMLLKSFPFRENEIEPRPYYSSELGGAEGQGLKQVLCIFKKKWGHKRTDCESHLHHISASGLADKE
jgi:hypothetical protein